MASGRGRGKGYRPQELFCRGDVTQVDKALDAGYLEHRGVGQVELQPLALDELAGLLRFLTTLLG